MRLSTRAKCPKASFLIFVLSLMILSAFAAVSAGAQQDASSEMKRSTVARQCVNDLRKFDQQLADVGFGVLPLSGSASSSFQGYGMFAGSPRLKLRRLRDAAYIYAFDGDENACQSILVSMREIYEKHQKVLGAEADQPNVRTAWRRAHLQRAKSITDMRRLMRADLLIGSDLRNDQDEKLGEIEDLVIDPAKQSVVYVLASRGGFLGIGEKLTAVRWSDIRATGDHRTFVLDVTRTAFDAAPKIQARKFAEIADASWRRKMDEFWNAKLKN